MGFGDWLVGALNKIGDCVCKAFNCVCDVMSKAGSLGHAIAVGVQALAVVFPPLAPIARVAAAVIEVLALVCTNRKTNVEELGDKAMNAEKHRDDFPSAEAYRDYLDKEVPFDREAFNKLSPEEQEARRFLGMEIALEHIEEKIALPIRPEDLLIAIRAGLTGAELGELAKEFKALGFESMRPLESYFKRTLDDASRAKVEEALGKVLHKEGAKLDEKGVNERLDSLDATFEKGIDPEQMKSAGAES